MPTIRSHYRYEQFEEVLQQLAHKLAKKIVEDLPETAEIKIRGQKLDRVVTDDFSIRFFSKRAKVVKNLTSDDWFGFEVEKKLYTTSNHCSKISFWAPEDEEAAKKKQIEEFIEKIMSEAGVTPVARFSLEKYTAP
ncbi:MAG: hypothetical protein U9O89_06575 [Thermoproteota archaeon]|nr:hypothetical protein [Thermoproteota archaeon]